MPPWASTVPALPTSWATRGVPRCSSSGGATTTSPPIRSSGSRPITGTPSSTPTPGTGSSVTDRRTTTRRRPSTPPPASWTFLPSTLAPGRDRTGSHTPPNGVHRSLRPTRLALQPCHPAVEHRTAQHLEGEVDVGVRAQVPVVPSLFEELAPVGQAGGDHPHPVQLQGVGVVPIGHESTEHPHARRSEPAVELDQESAEVGLGVARRSGRDLRRALGVGAGDVVGLVPVSTVDGRPRPLGFAGHALHRDRRVADVIQLANGRLGDGPAGALVAGTARG